MKRLHLSNSNYKYLEQAFKQWLDVLGYSLRTVNGSPLQIREMFHYVEQKNIGHITKVKPRHISGFINHLKTRENLMHGGALSASSINSYMGSINLFARYLSQSGRYDLDVITKRMENDVDERKVLTREEIKSIYEASFEPHRQNTRAMGQRDRAIIAVFYGCGLRKNEGAGLDITDIDFAKRLVFVKKAKGGKQRYVPIAHKHLEDLRSYMEEGRYWFLQDNRNPWHVKKGVQKQHTSSEALLLNMAGKRMQSFEGRLKLLKERSGIETPFSTHSLRHSIATHLLQGGMQMGDIAKFLGHSSLASTQIYTHIVNHFKKQEDAASGILLLSEE